MSWMKRRGHTASPSNVSSPEMYSVNQHSNQEIQSSQWHQQDLTSNNWLNQTSQNQPKEQPYQYNPPQSQPNHWQQPYATNNYTQSHPNQYQQQQLYSQQNPQQHQYPPGPLNDQYNQQAQRYGYNKTEVQNHPYSIQPQQPQQPLVAGEDAWGGTWGWGDEYNSNIQPQQNLNSAVPVVNITDSFKAEESWNWSVDESSSSTSTLNYIKPEHSDATTSLTSLDSLKLEPVPDQHNILDNNDGQVNKNLPQEPVKPPSVMKLRNSENLTPQWSVESQMSQESSDDVLQTSESDKMLSRSSTISQSPISGQDGFWGNLMPVQELPNSKLEQDLKQFEEPEIGLNPQSQQYENIEILSTIKLEGQQNYIPPAISPNIPGTSYKSQTPPPPVQNLTPPPSTEAVAKTHTPPPPLMSSHGSLDDLKNPYKRNTALSHAAASKNRILNPSMVDRPSPPGFQPFTQSVNLETLPDNSEQPDSLLLLPTNQGLKKNNGTGIQISTGQQLPDNNEVAPINERNQYLETGQLSDESTNQLQVDTNDALPPPGLRRMVLGQMESNDPNQNAPIDEPPPGLSRMVLGQTESSSSLINPRDSNGPPVGFSRMVPGESSSPETNSRHQYQVYQDDTRHEEYNSEVEMNQLHSNPLPQARSATIGADTPPTVAIPVITQSNMNRSETIGSDSKQDDNRSLGSISENRVGVGVDRSQRDNLIGATNQDSLHSSENRRDSIEGEPQDRDLKDLVSGVRDMTVSTDVGASTNELEQSSRGRSRQESSDSDREVDENKSPRDHRDRRYKEKEDRREKNRSRHSPDNYRRYDRRRPKDRRYEEESDYYSDKEKETRRDEKKEDYEKRYGTTRSKDKDRRKRDPRERRDPRDDRDVREGRDVRDGREVKDGREYERRDRDYHRDYDTSRREVRNRGDYYYYDDGYDGQRSRPSSRSDSMHDAYRDRHERDHRRQRPRDRNTRDVRRHRDFDPYMQGFNYDPYNPYYQQYQYYYENLRRTNPQAYLEWYRKYYQQAGVATSAANFSNEDRGSVHSGRSSANEDIKERYGRPFDTTESVLLDDSATQAQRLTPAKFATAHVKASISSGKLVKILPNYPLDGQSATVELVSVQHLLANDDEIEELAGFPGPLVRGITHKKTVIEYCENKIRNAGYNDSITDTSSYILLWELMILLIRQNGMVVGTDIAELLMKDRPHEMHLRPPSAGSNASSAIMEANTPSEASNVQSSEVINSSSVSILKEEVVTNKFREYLIYGSEKEALEWAMKHGLWGHALFLASKLDKRTYANVMMRFANGLTMNDPLQTLYQLLSGRIPAAVTAVADEKWGDWRPHLAMILSNTTKPDLNRKAITTLADTLMTRGSVYAAQFCYLMADVGFSRYDAENAKLVLLGSNHHRPFVQFATNEAIHLTEIYEYACSLNNAGFLILEFQSYKFLLATRLSDRGLLEKALAYLERVSEAIVHNATSIQPSLVDRVCHLADRLKYYDPVEETDENLLVEGALDLSRPDSSWLKELKAVQSDYNMGLISHESVNNLTEASPEYETSQVQQSGYENQAQLSHEAWQNQQQQLQMQQMQQQQVDQYQQWQTQQGDQEVRSDQLQQGEQAEGYHPGQYQDQQQQPGYWPQQTQQQWGGDVQQQHPVISYGNGQAVQEGQIEQQDIPSHQQANDYWNSAQNEDVSRPQITMPNQAGRQNSVESDETGALTDKTPKSSPAKSKPVQKTDKQASRTGWFGGIFSTFGLRPKNQMKLPDDKNPSIVWDEKNKKWVNLDEDGTETTSEFKPPPKMADFMPKMQQDPAGHPGIGEQQPIVVFQHATNPAIAPNPLSYHPIQQAHHITAQAPHGAAPVNPAAPAVSLDATGIPGNPPSAIASEEAPKPAQPNMFKLQRGRNLKKSYVDVFNPSGKSFDNIQTTMQNPVFVGATASGGGGQMNYFIPAPINDPNAPVDFLSPGNIITDPNQATFQQPQ